MELWSSLGMEFASLLSWQAILAIIAGVTVGILTGAMPGLSP